MNKEILHIKKYEDYPFSKLNNHSASIEVPTIKVVPCIISIPSITELLQYDSEKERSDLICKQYKRGLI
jgi:hypothetical protein